MTGADYRKLMQAIRESTVEVTVMKTSGLPNWTQELTPQRMKVLDPEQLIARLEELRKEVE